MGSLGQVMAVGITSVHTSDLLSVPQLFENTGAVQDLLMYNITVPKGVKTVFTAYR